MAIFLSQRSLDIMAGMKKRMSRQNWKQLKANLLTIHLLLPVKVWVWQLWPPAWNTVHLGTLLHQPLKRHVQCSQLFTLAYTIQWFSHIQYFKFHITSLVHALYICFVSSNELYIYSQVEIYIMFCSVLKRQLQEHLHLWIPKTVYILTLHTRNTYLLTCKVEADPFMEFITSLFTQWYLLISQFL